MEVYIRRVLMVAIFVLLVASMSVFAHGDEKHKGKMEKVTPATMMQKTVSDSADEHLEEAPGTTEEHSEEIEADATQKDLETILEETKKSTVATVIKVGSFVLALAGIVIAYFPRSPKTVTRSEEKEEE